MATNPFRNSCMIFALALAIQGCASKPSASGPCKDVGNLFVQYDRSDENRFAPRAKGEFVNDKHHEAVQDENVVALFKHACELRTNVPDDHSQAWGRIFEASGEHSAWIVNDQEVVFDAFKTSVKASEVGAAVKTLEGDQ